ncbi:putative phage tail assembly chaperone [Avibacterium paragallinarum]|uniref:Phage tail assembly chaperone n=4 Tax=Avibacterium paragallinarum TaxID=728 RepID=A0AAE5WGV4_AVIPA|nr:putative phage tail assembly chaperone [Avibacterium paragallinarum]MEE3608261.1 putative phage tail assembly chaperone [Avibacterium paragallinarum]MEE3621615.1 putative phage tail assembly chaperone [Avibacterium paragallinarum]MEE3669436.1 putative phage tail assembly chaperone [Avibacterium paragallinarum]MEE3680420.1 putative phage tail assembly chaperone [Avibacterium paragallinarum]MEE4385921.1 putative phage tail assembly chaperone [Avibacterium paragallinarum]
MKNEATQLLEKFGIKNTLTVEINGIELTFNRDDAAFDAFTNEVEKDNRITPIKDYLLATISKEHKETLLQIIHLPGVALALAEKVNKAFVADIEVKVKN